MMQQNLLQMIQTEKVEWKKLGDITDYEQPTKYLVKNTQYDETFDTPVLTAGKTFILGYTDETKGVYRASISPVIIFDDFTTANKWVDFDFKVKSSAMKMITSKDEEQYLLRYIYFWLNTLPSEKTDNDHKRQWISNYAQKKIPIPSLETQKKIVKILDKMTELEATLEAELSQRRRQYEYYRNALLDFNNDVGGVIAKLYSGRLKDVEWKTLGEVGTLIRGNGLQKKDFTETGVPAIHYGQIYTHYDNFAAETKSFVSHEVAKKLKKAQYGDVLIAGTSENVQDVMTPIGWLGGEIVFSGDMFAFRPNAQISTKYLTYLLQAEPFQRFKEKYAQGTKVIRVKSENFLKFEIPIPPLEIQQKIVAILDRFDTLTHSISHGLPHEIALRRRQYEYYREQLLNFAPTA